MTHNLLSGLFRLDRGVVYLKRNSQKFLRTVSQEVNIRAPFHGDFTFTNQPQSQPSHLFSLLQLTWKEASSRCQEDVTEKNCIMHYNKLYYDDYIIAVCV